MAKLILMFWPNLILFAMRHRVSALGSSESQINADNASQRVFVRIELSTHIINTNLVFMLSLTLKNTFIQNMEYVHHFCCKK